MTVENKPVRAIDIERWTPTKWEHIVGNRELVEHFRGAINAGGAPPNTLVTGPSRSGKTSNIKLAIRSMFCTGRDSKTLDPCGMCSSCLNQTGHHDRRGIESQLETPESGVAQHYWLVDCATIDERDLLSGLRDHKFFSGVQVFYLDEFDQLKRRGIDRVLLRALEDHAFSWIASCVSVVDQEKTILNRFSCNIATGLPTRDEMAIWLAHRCAEWDLQLDREETLLLLAERCNQVPGKALHVLASVAANPTRTLTTEIVVKHRFLDAEA